MVLIIITLSRSILLNHLNISETFKKPKTKIDLLKNEGIKVIIVTTWRSGSTFLEELIGSYPGMFIHYEPLLIYRQRNFYNIDDPETKKAQKIISDLLDCQYDEEYIKRVKKTPLKMFEKNKNLWNQCYSELDEKNYCYNKLFIEKTCKNQTLFVMKLVRLGVGLIEPILKSNSNIHILFLVRDPRAVMNSRRATVKWCIFNECKNTSLHCSHLEQDIKDLKKLQTLFPDRITLVRYEDLALSPLKTSKDIFKVIGLEFTLEVERFVEEHTKKNIDSPWSTVRKSSKHVLSWTKKIDNKTLVDVQNFCLKGMKTLGYKPVTSSNLTNLSVSSVLDQS
ncbi:UNVERIFIED_CONTAM: hypothetical protein RMT77_003031 [Armadillidium vulgare]